MPLVSKVGKGKNKKVNPRAVLEERRSYCDEVHDTLSSKGVEFYRPIEDGGTLNIDPEYLVLPANITEVSSRDLGEYLNAFTQQKVYMRTLLGYAEMYAEEARLDYIKASDPYFRNLLGSKMSETAKEREVNSNLSVRPTLEKWLDCKNKVRLLKYNIESIENLVFMISREVTRRVGDFSEERRDFNVNGK